MGGEEIIKGASSPGMRTLDEVRRYCDDCIAMWRDIRDNPSHELNEMARFYIDAFQSMRVSIFGELLPPS